MGESVLPKNRPQGIIESVRRVKILESIFKQALYLTQEEKDSLIQQLPDTEARNKLVMAHVNMLPKIVSSTGSDNYEDKLSVAFDKLIEGVDRYYEKGRTGLITPYLQHWVRFELYKYLRYAYKTVQIPLASHDRGKRLEVVPLSPSEVDKNPVCNTAPENIEYEEMLRVLKTSNLAAFKHVVKILEGKKVHRQTIFLMRQKFEPLLRKYLKGEPCRYT